MMLERVRIFKLCLSPILFSLLGLVSCAPHLGRSIEVPTIPPPVEQAAVDSRARLNVSLSVDTIKDVRRSVVAADAGINQPNYTEPHGPVGLRVKDALIEAFTTRGLQVHPNSNVTVWGEIRRWRTQVDARTTIRLMSEASLYLEVLDSNGKRKYSGTYHGSRMSQFPVATAEDIEDSLGLAMSSAIEEVVEDEEFLAALWRN